jgi:hypothetical protein
MTAFRNPTQHKPLPARKQVPDRTNDDIAVFTPQKFKLILTMEWNPSGSPLECLGKKNVGACIHIPHAEA